jgi:hypothetical protein
MNDHLKRFRDLRKFNSLTELTVFESTWTWSMSTVDIIRPITNTKQLHIDFNGGYYLYAFFLYTTLIKCRGDEDPVPMICLMFHIWNYSTDLGKDWSADPKGKDHLTDLSVDGMIIWKWIWRSKKHVPELEWISSEPVSVAGTCEHGNEPSASIKGREFIEQLSDH